MKPTAPKRLTPGASIRVVSPSNSGSILSDDTINRAVSRLKKCGFEVSFGKHWLDKKTVLGTGTTDDRLEDLHDAFSDPTVDGILTSIGGFNSNQLLDSIDYDLIRNNQKVFCGFSDITALANAIFARSGMITYLGPHFSSWAMEKGFDYSEKYFLKAVQTNSPYIVRPSRYWSDDEWYIDQSSRLFYDSYGFDIIHNGNAVGTIIGGNVDSFCNLLGTRSCPSFENAVLFLEQGDDTSLREFDARLESITQQSDFKKIKALIIGRFRKDETIRVDDIKEIINNKPSLNNIPVVANFNIGHTTPMLTIAIGGVCDIHIDRSVVIRIINH